MRILDHRYHRDRLRLGLALRFLQHRARTETISVWTGVTGDRVRKLYHSFLAPYGAPSRQRGKSPRQIAFFSKSPKRQQETAWLASLFTILGVIPPNSDALAIDSLPTLTRGTRICQAFELYSALTPSPEIPFEYAMFLASSLVLGRQLRLGACIDCGSLLVVDLNLIPAKRCHYCERAFKGLSIY